MSTSKGSPEFEAKLKEVGEKYAHMIQPRSAEQHPLKEFALAPEPHPVERVAKPVHAIEHPASPALMVKTCRALKVLHGWGITWHTIGAYVIFYTPGDLCGCADCNTYLQALLKGVHP